MSDWQQYKGGARWRYLEDGRLVFEDGLKLASPDYRPHLRLDDEGAVRTKGEPATARTLIAEHGDNIIAAAKRFKVSPALVASMILCESGRREGSLSRDPISIRFEPGYIDDEATPGKVSAGLMQTLLRTARDMCGAASGWSPANAVTNKPRLLVRQDLYIPDVSILLGVAYIAQQSRRYKTQDVLLMHAAYNCGGIYESPTLSLKLKAYGKDDRFVKAAAYLNDWIAAGGAR